MATADSVQSEGLRVGTHTLASRLIVGTGKYATCDQMREALDALLETIAQTLAEGDQVALSDFGRFCLQHYPGRTLQRFDGEGRYTVEDRSVPVFKSSAALRRQLREECS